MLRVPKQDTWVCLENERVVKEEPDSGLWLGVKDHSATSLSCEQAHLNYGIRALTEWLVGASAVAQWCKPPLKMHVMLSSHTGMPVWGPASTLFLQLPANAPGKAGSTHKYMASRLRPGPDCTVLAKWKVVQWTEDLPSAPACLPLPSFLLSSFDSSSIAPTAPPVKGIKSLLLTKKRKVFSHRIIVQIK